MTRATLTRLGAIAGLSAFFATSPTLEADSSRTFENASWEGFRVDYCESWGQRCGQPAADAFCRLAGFDRAEAFSKADNIGASSPTRTLSDRRVCNASNCDGFSSISCVRTGSRTTSGTRPGNTGAPAIPPGGVAYDAIGKMAGTKGIAVQGVQQVPESVVSQVASRRAFVAERLGADLSRIGVSDRTVLDLDAMQFAIPNVAYFSLFDGTVAAKSGRVYAGPGGMAQLDIVRPVLGASPDYYLVDVTASASSGSQTLVVRLARDGRRLQESAVLGTSPRTFAFIIDAEASAAVQLVGENDDVTIDFHAIGVSPVTR